jgi:hypothetical protein
MQTGIDLDPASCERANSVIQAKKIYTKDDNGLYRRWYGNVWCNPPYLNGAALDWLKVAVNKWLDREFDLAILLLNRSDNKDIYNIIDSGNVPCYYQLRHRVKFVNGKADEPKSAPRYNNDLFYFGRKPNEFYDFCHSKFGMPAPTTKFVRAIKSESVMKNGVVYDVK